MWLRRVAAGVAAGSLANAAQMMVVPLLPVVIGPGLFYNHWLSVVLVHVVLAVTLAGVRENRPWAAAAFLFPIVAEVGPRAHTALGAPGLAAFLAVALGAAALWSLRSRSRGAPWVAATAGAAAAALVPLLRGLSSQTGLPGPAVVALAAAATGLALAAVILAGRGGRAAVPRVGRSVLASAAAVAAAAVPAWFTGLPRFAPPASLDPTRPPIVLIVLETVRASHLELYGYERETMPNLTRFAREHGVVVDRAIANGPSSLPSHASLFTGLHPPRHGAHKPFRDDPNPPPYAYPLRKDVDTLAFRLARAGYWTVAISANHGPLSPEFGLHRGFQFYRAVPGDRHMLMRFSAWGLQPPKSALAQRWLAALDRVLPFWGGEYLLGVHYQRAEAITDLAIAALDSAGHRPIFLFLNYLDAHTPYDPPAPFRDRFPGRDPALGVGGVDEATREAVLAGERDLTPAEREHLRALYDGELAYLDAQLGRLLDTLETRPRWRDTLVVITSDHGEALGEHGLLGHSLGLYDEVTWVPLVVKPGADTPGAPPPGSRMAGPFESVDVFATALAHARVPAPDGIDGLPWGEGRDRALAWLYPDRATERYPRLAGERRSVEHSGWKLIRSSAGDVELYDLGDDPGETSNLAADRTGLRHDLEVELSRGAKEERRSDTGSGTISRETLERLRDLGYVP